MIDISSGENNSSPIGSCDLPISRIEEHRRRAIFFPQPTKSNGTSRADIIPLQSLRSVRIKRMLTEPPYRLSFYVSVNVCRESATRNVRNKIEVNRSVSRKLIDTLSQARGSPRKPRRVRNKKGDVGAYISTSGNLHRVACKSSLPATNGCHHFHCAGSSYATLQRRPCLRGKPFIPRNYREWLGESSFPPVHEPTSLFSRGTATKENV